MRLEIVRGTAVTFKVYVVDADGAAYDVADGERVEFGVKAETDTGPIFTVTATPEGGGIYAVDLAYTLTKDLQPGRYFYDVSVVSGGVPYNAVPLDAIDILDTVTGGLAGSGGGGGA